MTPPKPGSGSERAISTEVLLNLCAAISWNKYATSNVIEDFYSMLKVSSNIRDGFIGPFDPLPGNITEKLMSYSRKRDISDVIKIIDKYTECTNEISEFVSLKMSAALPFTYDRFIVFLVWRPTANMSMEPVDKLATEVRSVYQSIIKTDGIYEHTKRKSSVLAKAFNEATQLKNAFEGTIKHLFEAIDHNNEKEYDELKHIIENQLNKLNEKVTTSIQTLRRLKIKEILSKLSTVHRRFYETALEIFHDEFKKPTDVVDNDVETSLNINSLPDALRRKMPVTFDRLEQTYRRYTDHIQFVFYLYLILFIILFLCIFARFNRNFYSLWRCFHQCIQSK